MDSVNKMATIYWVLSMCHVLHISLLFILTVTLRGTHFSSACFLGEETLTEKPSSWGSRESQQKRWGNSACLPPSLSSSSAPAHAALRPRDLSGQNNLEDSAGHRDGEATPLLFFPKRKSSSFCIHLGLLVLCEGSHLALNQYFSNYSLSSCTAGSLRMRLCLILFFTL